MSGPNPILANYRTQHDLVVSGFTHKIRNYLEVAASADPTGYSTVARSPHLPVGVSAAMDGLWTVLAPAYNGTVVFGVAHLQQRTGTTWNDVAVWNTSVVPTSSSITQVGWGCTIAMTDLLHRRLPVVLTENIFSSLFKATSLAGLFPVARALVDYYCGTGTIANSDAFCWRQSRSLSFVGAWTSLVIDSNEFMRRKRGLK